MDQTRYNRAIEAAQLKSDLKLLKGGDLCEIGDRGITLSGGQMQRLAIARALYLKGTEMFLLDDALSALDVHVAEALFQQCIVGEMKNQTRILTLNSHYHLLSKANKIVVMSSGSIACSGTYQQVKHHPAFIDLTKHRVAEAPVAAAVVEQPSTAPPIEAPIEAPTAQPIEPPIEAPIEQPIEAPIEPPIEPPIEHPSATTVTAVVLDCATMETQLETKMPALCDTVPPVPPVLPEHVKGVMANKEKEELDTIKLILDEDRATGAVTLATYQKYYASVNGNSWVGFAVVFVFFVAQTVRTLDDVWLASWVDSLMAHTNASTNTTTHTTTNTLTPNNESQLWLTMYGSFAGGSLLLYLFSSGIFVYCAINASRHFHHEVLTTLLKASVPKFFDVTPIGRVLNRFARDVDQIDQLLPDYGIQLLQNTAFFIASAILCAVSNVYLIYVLVPLAALFIAFAYVSRFTIRELKRLEGISRSPVLSGFSEALSGVTTIRSAGATPRFLQVHRSRIDVNCGVYRTMWECGCWFGIHVDFLGALVVFVVSFFAVWNVGSSTAGNGLVGVALTFALQFTSLLQWTVRVFIETENCMTSVERLNFYAERIPRENDVDVENKTSVIAPDWPSKKSAIVINNYSMRYRANLDYALQNLTLHIRPQEKFGICGRTGAGKSSLISALLRLCEGGEGSIAIDGIDIKQVPLPLLRSKISLIPQHPFLFATTVRGNLDPFEEYGDDTIWSTLERVGLATHRDRSWLGLKVTERGENLSAGTRQLICVGRALLRQSSIILMDEASANVDSATDAMLQQMMRTCFAEATVVVVAHRVNTILDCDRIAVLSGGRLVECDTPGNLLADKDSEFKKLVEQMRKDQQRTPSGDD